MTTEGSPAPDAVRQRLVLSLDTDDLVLAARTARDLQPWFGVVRIGLELYFAAGPDAIETMRDLGYEVFVDLKLHDEPTTVHRAARVLGALGASFVTLHARDDAAMLRSGVDGLATGAAAAGLPGPTALAVTVLTSDSGAPPHIMPKRAALAAETGCGGIVCAGMDLHDALLVAPRLLRVVPAELPPLGSPSPAPRAPMTPAAALAGGGDLLVVGRSVTEADEPPVAASQLASLVDEATRSS